MKNLSSKGWFHKDGTLIQIPDEGQFIAADHVNFVADNPHLFGTTDEELQSKTTPISYKRVKEGTDAWNQGIHNFLGKKGFMRFTKGIEQFKEGNHYNLIISNEGNNSTPEDMVAPLKLLKTHIQNLKEGETFGVNLNGFSDRGTLKKFLEERGLKHGGYNSVNLTSMNSINKYIGESGGEISREPERQQQVPSGTQIRQAIGKKPEQMSAAEYNFYRIIGDSYKPTLIGFKRFLKESLR